MNQPTDPAQCQGGCKSEVGCLGWLVMMLAISVAYLYSKVAWK